MCRGTVDRHAAVGGSADGPTRACLNCRGLAHSVVGRAGHRGRELGPRLAHDAPPDRPSPPTTCTPASACHAMPAPRRSSSGAGRCCASTIPTWRDRPAWSWPSASTSPTTGSATPNSRVRYDRERSIGIRGGRPPRGEPRRARPRRLGGPFASTDDRRAGRVRGRTRRPADADELDRLALAEPAPIAFLATLRQFVEPDLERTLRDAEGDAIAALPAAARRMAPIRDAVVGRLADAVIGDVLEEILGDPAALRARERLTRGWDAAVGQPRYGPATTAVAAMLERVRGLDADELRLDWPRRAR